MLPKEIENRLQRLHRMKPPVGLRSLGGNVVGFVVVGVVFVVGIVVLSFQASETSLASSGGKMALVMKQRDGLSKRANALMQQFMQLHCRSSKKRKVSLFGGWCSEVGSANGSSHRTDLGMVRFLGEFLAGKSVGSFGDGPGEYKRLLDASGAVASYRAFDGAPFGAAASDGRVEFLDLTLEAFGLPVFDWVVSLEVGEHIPREFESVFLDNLARHAREGVVVSWAAPGQRGVSHVNNRHASHVVREMERRGFARDAAATRGARRAATLSWLRSNAMVFRRQAPVDEAFA